MKTHNPQLKPLSLSFERITLISLLSLFVSSLFSQSYINTKWKQYSANPATYDNAASAVTSNGDIVTTANNLIGAATQIYLNRIQSNGTMAWQQNCTGSPSNNNYGSDIKADASGNIYTCGAYHNGTNYNYRIAKYLANGSLSWQQFYNGPGNNDDIPSAIELDNSGNIYVTGSSYGLNTMPDFATLKFSNSGNQIWISRYNFANLPDGASDICVDGSGNVFVTGSSATSFFNADVAIVKYNGNTGAQLNVYRHSYAGNGLDGAAEMCIDNSNNILITGSFDNGTKKFGTLKLSNSLAQTWFNTVTGAQTSEGNGIHSDNSGAVVSVGYRNNGAG
ncbi:MAG: SBBP repeat-containing protein, partial [Bacteroidetes bacterium]|nr:SBBP repeat-containing protein [Bacteroidota bacterium]